DGIIRGCGDSPWRVGNRAGRIRPFLAVERRRRGREWGRLLRGLRNLKREDTRSRAEGDRCAAMNNDWFGVPLLSPEPPPRTPKPRARRIAEKSRCGPFSNIVA